MAKMFRDLGLLFYLTKFEPVHSIQDVPNYIGRSIPYFILLILVEVCYGKIRGMKLYSSKDTIMSISLGIFQQLVGLCLKEVMIIPYQLVYSYFHPNPIPRNAMFLFLLGFLGNDLCYYLFHREAHVWHVIWGAHSVHHSGERYNFATALRQGAFQSLASWIFYLPLAILGLPPAEHIRHSRLNTLYQFWVHTEIVGRLPWPFEGILNTPSHHRLHHRPPGNCNYGGVLIIWDRLFGTFVSELSSESTDQQSSTTTSTNISKSNLEWRHRVSQGRSPIYGLAKPLNSFDPIFANVSHFLRLSEDIDIHPNHSTSLAQSQSQSHSLSISSICSRIHRLLSRLFKRRVVHPWPLTWIVLPLPIPLPSLPIPCLLPSSSDISSISSFLSFLFLPAPPGLLSFFPSLESIRDQVWGLLFLPHFFTEGIEAWLCRSDEKEIEKEKENEKTKEGKGEDKTQLQLTPRERDFIRGRADREGQPYSSHPPSLSATFILLYDVTVWFVFLLSLGLGFLLITGAEKLDWKELLLSCSALSSVLCLLPHILYQTSQSTHVD